MEQVNRDGRNGLRPGSSCEVGVDKPVAIPQEVVAEVVRNRIYATDCHIVFSLTEIGRHKSHNENHLVLLGVSAQIPSLVTTTKTTKTIGTESNADNQADKLAYVRSKQK